MGLKRGIARPAAKEVKSMPDKSNGDADVFEHRYSRERALREGTLVDLSEWARELGFVFPVACTAAVWRQYLMPHESVRRLGQSERTRVHDLLWVLRRSIGEAGGGAAAAQLTFDVMFLMLGGTIAFVRLKAVCGPGDRGEPVITVMLPDED